jgi:RNA polymerase sigma factor (sigma-70 family)
MVPNGVRTAQNDEELVKDCLDGDEAAWAELIRKHQRLIYSVARVLCPEPSDTADVFQQVCLDLYQRLPQIRDIQCLPKWLVTVTRRRSVDLLRRKPKTTELEADQLSCDSQIETLQRHRDLECALAQLPDRCRRLLVQLYFSEEPSTYVEVTKHLGIPASSIGPTRARCLQKLRALMESA